METTVCLVLSPRPQERCSPGLPSQPLISPWVQWAALGEVPIRQKVFERRLKSPHNLSLVASA